MYFFLLVLKEYNQFATSDYKQQQRCIKRNGCDKFFLGGGDMCHMEDPEPGSECELELQPTP